MEKTCPQVLSVYKYELLQWIIAPILETPFFFISNVKILLIIKKSAKPSTLGMYYGGTNQEPKIQRSRKTGKEEQEK